jgi:hypothetical protein
MPFGGIPYLVRIVQVRAASTANVTLTSPGATFDGVTLTSGKDRVLLKDQTNPAEDGVYDFNGSAATLTRSPDAGQGRLVDSFGVRVQEGALNAETRWEVATDDPITIGSTAIRFTRVYPAYRRSDRNPWDPGATPPIGVNMDRESANASVAQTAITAITSMHGGLTIPAGRLVTNINAFCLAAGAGTVTTFWFAIVRLSDRATLQRTANSTVLPTLNAVHTRALQATLTLDYDTPCYIAWGSQVATTSPGFAGIANVAAVQPFHLTAPIFQGNSTTAPTATPPTLGAVLGAPTTATSGRIFFWLT